MRKRDYIILSLTGISPSVFCCFFPDMMLENSKIQKVGVQLANLNWVEFLTSEIYAERWKGDWALHRRALHFKTNSSYRIF